METSPRLRLLLAERRARTIRGSLDAWARHCGFEPAAHHRLLTSHLERVSAGNIDRLMVLMPPGSAKSTYVSMLFPAWYLGQHSTHSIVAASHTAEFAEKWGRRVRNLARANPGILGVRLAADSTAAGRWALTDGGEYYATGVGGTVTGHRADLAVIDDPFRGRADADSAAIRDRVWEWYRTDLYTRLKPGARIVLMHTRWHEDDLAGRLLATEPERWTVLKLPMEAGPGDALGRPIGARLWPEYFTEQMLEDAKRDLRTWTCLWQQNPTPPEGNFFKSAWLKYYAEAPRLDRLHVYGASDYAVTDSDGDWTVHAVFGVDTAGEVYLLDLWRGQTASDKWVEAWCDLVERWRPLTWAEETGQIKAGVGPFRDRRARERKTFTELRAFPSRSNKQIRAQSIRGRMAMRGLSIPINAKWRTEFEQELLHFPAGTHDDQVDALSLFGQLIDVVIDGKNADGSRPVPPAGTTGRLLYDERVKPEPQRL